MSGRGFDPPPRAFGWPFSPGFGKDVPTDPIEATRAAVARYRAAKLPDAPPGMHPAQWAVYLAVRFAVPGDWRISTTVNDRGEVLVNCRHDNGRRYLQAGTTTGFIGEFPDAVLIQAERLAARFAAGIDDRLYEPGT